ncbi:MAG: AEC family transporter [Gammaproteobacteria bacterium]|nr:AEC family transporter [Gammaproteobacteria bacterium]MDH4253299.1 AEC family transporter [Gammaproteobacteria bacterium]MDH5310543.1 AEC family transporter [Gammaproteobacteria bacterium]
MPWESLLPIFLYVLAGISLRAMGLVERSLAEPMFRFVFLATLPALVFVSIVEAPLDRQSALLPAVGFLMNSISAFGAWAYARRHRLPEPQAGALVLCAGITNGMFMFPFVLAILGQPGLTIAILVDVGNAVFVATVGYAISVHYAHAGSAIPAGSLLRMLRSPLFIALLIALAVNLGSFETPAPLVAALQPLGRATMPVTLVALGISLTPRAFSGSLPSLTVMLRMLLGLGSGLLFAGLLGLEGLTAVIVIAIGAAPVGFMSVTIVSVAKCDTGQAASAVSISVLIGMLTTTAILFFGPGLLGVG